MPMRHFICKRQCIILLCNNNCTLEIYSSLIESFVPNCNDLYGQKEPGNTNRFLLPGSICRIVLRHISGLATQALGHLDQLLYTHKNPTEYC